MGFKLKHQPKQINYPYVTGRGPISGKPASQRRWKGGQIWRQESPLTFPQKMSHSGVFSPLFVHNREIFSLLKAETDTQLLLSVLHAQQHICYIYRNCSLWGWILPQLWLRVFAIHYSPHLYSASSVSIDKKFVKHFWINDIQVMVPRRCAWTAPLTCWGLHWISVSFPDPVARHAPPSTFLLPLSSCSAWR